METVIEIQRRCHEERERLMEAMVKESVRHKVNIKDSVFSEHIVKLLLDRYMEVTERLVNAYEDIDGLRYEEVNALGGPAQFSEFYVRVKQLRENNRKSNFKDEVAVPLSVEIDQLVNGLVECCAAGETGLVSFTDEESWGRCLDLTSLHQQYLQLRVPGSQPMDYLTYVQQFDRLFELMSRERKLSISSPYKRYLRQLIDYLYNFLKRVHPLMNVDVELQTALDDFERDWTAGNFPGWPPREGGALTRSGAALADLAAFSSPEELASLGLDRLKSALMALGLKCGGTLKERADRLFAAARGQVSPQCIPRARSSDVAKEIGKLEVQVYKLAELVSVQRACTIENVQRKQARVGIDDDEEMDAENMDDLDDELDDESEGTIYNPKNLPLGWDGKPIPYWLYKLHGLNIYYNCEICGNYKYRGPKAFQRHFAEWRHAHGMRCLGIPNTAHFANITLIEDAVALWDRLRRKKEADHWKPEVDEEFEDSSGNVVSKKVFEDLRRQGLL